MKQLYGCYKDNEKLSSLLREISCTNNLHILAKTRFLEEKEFYIRPTSSIILHEKCGFRKLGIREKIAKMSNGKWHDVVLMERRSKIVEGCNILTFYKRLHIKDLTNRTHLSCVIFVRSLFLA